MTKEQHMKRYTEYREKSASALARYGESFSLTDWEEYKMYTKLANKEFGIAQMMWTKEINKGLKELGISI